jgi:hypothetical protein
MLTAILIAALQAPVPLDQFLRERLGFSDQQRSEIAAGRVVTRVLTTTNDEEIAIVGVVRLPVSADSAVGRVWDTRRLARRRETTQFGRFGVPPTPADLARFQLPDADRQPLRECRSARCALKLPTAVIERVGAIDWRAPNADSAATVVLRNWMLEYVRGYVAIGNDALIIYGDAETPLPLHTGFHALLAESPYVFNDAPSFHHYLNEFPRRPLPGVEDTLYWSSEDIGLRPLTTVTHASLYRPPPGGAAALIARKQVYASHYFHAALSIVTIIDDPRAAADPASYVIDVQRFLFDTRLGGFVRRKAQGRLAADLQSRLETLGRPVG